MTIESECPSESRTPHDFKAHTVDKTQIPAPSHKVSTCGRFMNLACHPNEMQDGHDVAFENSHGVETQPPEDDSRSLDQDVVVADKNVFAAEQLDPPGFGSGMIAVVLVKNG